jgi:hypothetical protein
MASGEGGEGDDDPDKDDEDDDAQDMAAHDAKADDASAKHRAAADAAEAAKGTDSAAALMAYETAHDEAMEAGSVLKASCASMRGAEPEPAKRDSSMPPPPAAPGANARALSALAPGASAATHLELAGWAAFGKSMAASLGATSAAQAQVLGAEAVAALKELPKAKAALHARDVQARLASAVHAGMPREKAFNVAKDGKAGAPLAHWSKMSVEDLDATLTLMGYPNGAPADVRSTLVIAAPPSLDDEAGLAARAKASGMTLEERRAAEENQRRSAELERGRHHQETTR